jgi:dienelactone hydrolase
MSAMTLSRRELLSLALATPFASTLSGVEDAPPNVHRQILELAAEQERVRRVRFAAVKSPADLAKLQSELRDAFVRLLDWTPSPADPPPVKVTGTIEADDYRIDKFVYETQPGYFVPALLYVPRNREGKCPGVISPCGHSATGKAANTYQILHVNLAKRGFVVLTYDPVGQGERSQFWDTANSRSRFDLQCGEHAVLGNPLYLLGTSLARYRIADGVRAIDYLVSLPNVDSTRIGCVGNSGGGTLTSYIAALDARVHTAAIGCYITTLPRRMGNRIQRDPDADPEQDIFGFVRDGIDHAGLLALRAPRPTLVGSAVLDFFPIEGARESSAEAKALFATVGAAENFRQAESPEKHGLGLPLRRAVYGFFERHLAGKKGPDDLDETPFEPRPVKDLLVCAEGQVNVSFKSKSMLTLALEDFDSRKPRERVPLRELLKADSTRTGYALHDVVPLSAKRSTLMLFINGNESPDWRQEQAFLRSFEKAPFAVSIIDPRGVCTLRPDLMVKLNYTNPLVGVEENIAYNAFLVGQSLLGMRVADARAAIEKITTSAKLERIIVCGRADAALVALFLAAIEPKVERVALEGIPTTFRNFFDTAGKPINAASILPNILRDFGDVANVLEVIAPKPVMIANAEQKFESGKSSVTSTQEPIAKDPSKLLAWAM